MLNGPDISRHSDLPSDVPDLCPRLLRSASLRPPGRSDRYVTLLIYTVGGQQTGL